MTEVTPDNAARATPVAWAMTDYQPEANTQYTGDKYAAEHWGNQGIQIDPLFSAATVAALEADVERLRSQVSYEFSERELATKQRDDAWEREAAHKQQADAAERRVAELEVRAEMAEWRVSDLREVCKWALKEILDSAEARNYNPPADTDLIASLEHQITKESP